MRLLITLAALLLATGAQAAQPPEPQMSAAGPPASASADPATYMAAIARQTGVTVTGSGLAYRILKSGPASGAHPRFGDQVRVSYEGRLADGTVFDASASNGGPVVLTIGQLVAGWNEALPLMRPGDDWTLYLPPSLGYGDQATGPIPADSVLVFRLQLLAVVVPPS